MSTSESTTASIRVIVVTPEEAALDTQADFVALPLLDGELGVARQHSPMIGRLCSGELRIRTDSNIARYYVEGGFVQVVDNMVSIMTSHMQASEDVDMEAAQEQLDAALQIKAAGDEQIASRDRQISQARAKLRIARRVK